MICKECNHKNEAAAKFCNNCGSALAVNLTCGTCGKTYPAGTKFCSEDGAKLEANDNKKTKTPEKSEKQSKPKKQVEKVAKNENDIIITNDSIVGDIHKELKEKYPYLLIFLETTEGCILCDDQKISDVRKVGSKGDFIIKDDISILLQNPKLEKVCGLKILLSRKTREKRWFSGPTYEAMTLNQRNKDVETNGKNYDWKASQIGKKIEIMKDYIRVYDCDDNYEIVDIKETNGSTVESAKWFDKKVHVTLSNGKNRLYNSADDKDFDETIGSSISSSTFGLQIIDGVITAKCGKCGKMFDYDQLMNDNRKNKTAVNNYFGSGEYFCSAKCQKAAGARKY